MKINFQKITSSSQKLIICRREEVDACSMVVLSSEELFRTWI
jgi:interleukin 20 receptor beta